MGKRGNVDRGYAWVIIGACWLQMVVSGVIYYSAGVVNTAVLHTLDEGVVATSWVGSTLLGGITLTGPVTGSLTKLMGCRIASMTGGLLILIGMVAAAFVNSVSLLIPMCLIVGMGVGFLDTGSVVITSHYFEKYRSIAAGIQSSGTGFGMLVGAPFVRFLMDVFGLRGAFLLLGALGAQACVSGLLMRPSKYESKKKDEDESEINEGLLKSQNHILQTVTVSAKDTIQEYGKLACSLPFVLYLLTMFFWNFGETAMIVHLTNYVESKGTSPQRSAVLYTAMGVASLFSRLLGGLAASDPAIGAMMLLMGSIGLLGIATLLFPALASTYTGQMIYTTVYGLYSGGPIAFFVPIAVDLAGVNRMSSAMGLKNLVSGVGVLAGPPLAAYLLEATGNFDNSFIFAGCCMMAACVMSLLIPVAKHHSPSAPDRIEVEVKSEGKDSAGVLMLKSEDGHSNGVLTVKSEDEISDGVLIVKSEGED